MKWLVIELQQYSENTPEYGCGDYPDQIEYIAAVVEGDTTRKAQNATKKVLPRVRFGGMFSPRLIPLDTATAQTYIKTADPRLWGKALERHNASLSMLTETPTRDWTHTAFFDPSRYILTLWITDNQLAERSCDTWEKAKRLIAATGIAQNLEATVWQKPKNA